MCSGGRAGLVLPNRLSSDSSGMFNIEYDGYSINLATMASNDVSSGDKSRSSHDFLKAYGAHTF